MQKLNRYIEPEFLEYSYAYQEGKGIQEAAQKAREYIESGYSAVVEIDLKDYFDTIPLEPLLEKIRHYITDTKVLQLIKSYLYCKVSVDEEISEKREGLVQGNSISPVLSNLYLHDFDQLLQERHYCWLRFADNIYIYEETMEKAGSIYSELCSLLEASPWQLKINYAKSGVYPDATMRRFLGYTFSWRNKKLEIRKCTYKDQSYYYNWHPCVVQKINQEYHIVQDGVLNKKDYAMLFENEDKKHHIPVEVTQQLNIYSEVTVTSSVLRMLSQNRIRAVFVDRYGNLTGHFVPSEYGQSALVTLKQCERYLDSTARLEMARAFEIAGIHNMRANIRYYHKKNKGNLELTVQELSGYMKEVNEAKTVENLLLTEARARQKYYAAFNDIIAVEEFAFVNRTRRPPRDALNAMLSFGNVLLYNLILQAIWRTTLDPRIGIVHSTNRRSASLNLDFADVFKPILVDRTIFTLINCHQIKLDDFEQKESGVYLSDNGKRIFIKAFQNKLQQKLILKGKEYTYRRLLEQEIRDYQNAVLHQDKYRPYKYY